MLSRVADNLYWMSRYLERTEHTARLLRVAVDLYFEQIGDSERSIWQRLYASLRLQPAGIALTDAYAMTNQLTFDRSLPASIISVLGKARQNTRQVRELVSSEMWEQINRLYLYVDQRDIDAIWSESHDFFLTLIEKLYLIQGVSDSTMSHGEGWHFIQVGRLMERVLNSVALLEEYLAEGPPREGQPRTVSTIHWIALLRNCTAFEAYCKAYAADFRFQPITKFLLLDDDFPHAIRYAVHAMQSALSGIALSTETHKNTQVYRLTGRLGAQLDFDEIDDIIAAGLPEYLERIREQCEQIHRAIYHTYIDYAIEDKLAL